MNASNTIGRYFGIGSYFPVLPEIGKEIKAPQILAVAGSPEACHKVMHSIPKDVILVEPPARKAPTSYSRAFSRRKWRETFVPGEFRFRRFRTFREFNGRVSPQQRLERKHVHESSDSPRAPAARGGWLKKLARFLAIGYATAKPTGGRHVH